MRKNLFIKSMLCLLLGLVCNVVWAQTGTPVLTYENITAPQELSAEDATKIRALDGMTFVADVEITNSSDVQLLFAAVADYTSNSTANNSIWGLGFGGNQMRYIVGPKDGGWYSRGSISTAAKKIVYTYDGTNITFFVDGTRINYVSSTKALNTFADANAKFYLGGVVYNTATKWGTFSGTIKKVEIYEGVMTDTEIGLLQLSNNDTYKVSGSRGFIYATESGELKGTNVASTEYDASSDYHHFAIVKYEDKYYLYNIGAQKFVVRNGNGTGGGVALSDQPLHAFTITGASNTSAGYPWVLNLNGANVHLSNGSGHTYGIRCASGEDEGTRWKFDKAGTFDASEVEAKIADYVNTITTLEQLSNDCSYKVYGSRGFIYATENGELKGTNVASVDYDATNDYHRFAILKSGENYYLYNVGAKKFVVKNGNTASLSDTPARQTSTLAAASTLTTDYDWVIRLNGSLTHLSNAASSGVYTNSETQDDGTRWAIYKMGTFDPEEALWVIENYDRQLPVTFEVEGLDEDNPNTHFGSVRATTSSGETLTKLLRGDAGALTMVNYDGTKETTIDFTREYRGFEFQGYWVGEEELGKSFTLTEELKSSINDESPLIAKFTATDDVTLFYDDDEFSYRIPAIDTTGTGRIIAVSDYRHNLDDIGRDNHGTGTKRIDLVIRTSDDNGKTWSDTMTIAAGDNSQTGSYLRAFGDAAIATVGENIVVMAAAGDVLYGSATAANPNRMARIFSNDNGETWTHQEMTTKMYLAEGIVQTGVAAFFGSGLLAVDADFNNTKTARIYGALLVRTYIEEAYNNYNNFVVYSDDLGLTWHILGGSQTPIASGDEPKVEILPNGQILLSARRNGGRVFNVFTYTDKESNAGTWSGTANGCGNGGSNSTNGEIFCVDAKKPDGTAVKLLLQSQPKGGSGQYDRKDVTIWYKEIDANTSYTATDIAANWTEGLQVSNQKSAYSTMTMQKDGKVAFFFEEAPCYADNHEKGYSMVYAPLTIETITKGNYFSPNADLNAEVAVNVVLTDAEGNEYRDQLTCALNGIATAVTAKYPFITLGDNTAIEYDGESYTYTNSVTLPFKVSNEDNTVWHHIYYPINTNEGNYPAYMSAAEGSDVVKIVSETAAYGNSTQNTLDNASRISWAIYQSKNDDFSFVLKNQSNGQYLKTTSDAPTGSGDENVRYASSIDEAAAFIPSTEGHSSNYQGEYSLKIGNGCICVWSVGNGYVTYSQNKGHKGAWAKFVEAPDFAALIDEVNSVLSLFGEGLGEYTPAEADKETLGIAKTAMQNSSSVKLNELNTYKALFTGATLNLPVEGQFFRIKAVEGWNNDAPYLGANNTTVNDKTTRAEFVAEADESTIFYYDGTQLVSYKSRHYLLNNNNFLGYNDVQASGTSIGFRAAAKGTVGAYNISFNNNRYLYTNKNNYTDAAGSTDNQDGYCFNLEEVTSLPVTISSVAYGTLYAPVALAIPEHVKAYTGVIDGDYLVLTKITTGIIPAKTGVVLYRDEESYDTAPEGATTHDFSIVANPESSVTSSFSGSVATIAKASVDGEAYTLQTDTESAIDVAFKPSADDITGGKAYLVLPTQQAARALRIRFAGEEEGGTTSIDEGQLTIDNGQLTIYDLQGRRVLNPTKGIYIVNGKKVLF